MSKSIPDMIREGADIFEERSAVYGDSFRIHGAVMAALLPERVSLGTVEDQNRFGVLTMIVSKLVRYAQNFYTGGHDDSLADLAVYTAILRKLDAEDREWVAALAQSGPPEAPSPVPYPPAVPTPEAAPSPALGARPDIYAWNADPLEPVSNKNLFEFDPGRTETAPAPKPAEPPFEIEPAELIDNPDSLTRITYQHDPNDPASSIILREF